MFSWYYVKYNVLQKDNNYPSLPQKWNESIK